MALNNESAECHFNLASAYGDLKKFNHAVKHYQESIRLESGNVDAHISLGGVYEEMKEPKLAATAFKAALKLDPESTKALEGIGRLKN